MDPSSILLATDQESPHLNTRGIFKNGTSFYCFICQKSQKDARKCLTHVLNSSHCQAIEKVITTCVEIHGNFGCRLCTDYVASSWKEFLIHFNESGHSTKFTQDEQLQITRVSNITLVNNQIIEQKPVTFFCYCCKETIIGGNSVQMHVEEKKHKEFQKNRTGTDSPINLTESECRKWARNFIFNLRRLDFYCILCDCSLPGQAITKQHIHTEDHVQYMLAKNNIIHQSLHKETVGIKNAQKESSDHAVQDDIITGPHNIMFTIDQISHNLNPRGIFKDDVSFNCLICNSAVKNLYTCLKHILAKAHCEKIEKIITSCVEIHGNLNCKFCTNYIASSWKQFLVHFNESNHSTKFTENEELQKSLVSNLTLVNNQIIEQKPGKFFCYCCKETMVGASSVHMHIKEEKHKEFQKNRMETYPPVKFREGECRKWAKNFIVNLYSLDFYCILCDHSLTEIRNTNQHIRSPNHVKCMFVPVDSIYQTLRTETVSGKNAQKESFLHATCDNTIAVPSGTSQFKHELFECKLSSSQVVSEYLSGQHHKNLIAIDEHLNSSPKGDVSADDLSRPIVEEPKQVIKKKVLRKTINPRYFNSDMQHIYDMNQEKLRMIKLSSQLCFPKALNAIYCLICQNSVPSQVQTFYEHIRSSSHVGYLAQMERDNQHFINYTEQWSDLMLSNEFLQEISDDTVQCFACDISLKNDDAVILLHVQKASHNHQKQLWNKAMDKFLHNILIQTESTWYNIQFYWCQSCDIQFKTEFFFTEHIDNKSHQKVLKKKSSVRKRLVYDTCIPCAALWLGFPEFYEQHCKHPLHKALVRSGDYSRCILPNQAKALLKNPKVEVSSLIESSNQVLTGQKVKVNSLLKCLENTIRSRFPDANAYPFGSRVSGLGFPDSDIDVFLDCGTYNGNTNFEDEAYQKHLISTVEQCLYDNTELWEIRETLVSSRTPIIKLHHRPTALSCDVSFKNGLSVENTKLLKCFIKNYPLCRQLMLFLKKWLYVCNLSGSRSITNYALCWYVIFYLQVEEILPSIASLIAKENRSKIIDNWETGICEKFEVDGKRRTFTELLNGFFIFYTDFDFYNSVACPLLGKTMLKKDFLKLHLLPKEMTPYIEHVTANNYDDSVVFKIDSEMCIQDPYDLSHNLTKAVHKFTLNRFKRLCAVSADTVKGVEHH